MTVVQPVIVIGDIVKLKSGRAGLDIALIIDIQKSEMPGDAGWTTFSYTVLTSCGSITYISDASVESVITSF